MKMTLAERQTAARQKARRHKKRNGGLLSGALEGSLCEWAFSRTRKTTLNSFTLFMAIIC